MTSQAASWHRSLATYAQGKQQHSIEMDVTCLKGCRHCHRPLGLFPGVKQMHSSWRSGHGYTIRAHIIFFEKSGDATIVMVTRLCKLAALARGGCLSVAVSAGA